MATPNLDPAEGRVFFLETGTGNKREQYATKVRKYITCVGETTLQEFYSKTSLFCLLLAR